MPPEPAFVIGLIAGWLATLLVQAFGRRKARQAISAVSIDLDAKRSIALLAQENDRQVGQMERMQERLAVLERITTDPSERTARAIDALRG